jgi:MCP family monocarboxylic acid transporter-like MFS transporter 10
MLTSIIAFASLCGPPISGAILTKTGSFLDVAAFAGSVVLLGTLLFGCAKYALLGTLRGKM